MSTHLQPEEEEGEEDSEDDGDGDQVCRLSDH